MLSLTNVNAMDQINASSQSKNEAVNQLKILLTTFQQQTLVNPDKPTHTPEADSPPRINNSASEFNDISESESASEFDGISKSEIEQLVYYSPPIDSTIDSSTNDALSRVRQLRDELQAMELLFPTTIHQ